MSKRGSDDTLYLALQTAARKRPSGTLSVTLTGPAVSQLSLSEDGVVLSKSTKETAMPELKHCPNCNDQKSVCRRCGRTPDQLYATNVPPCNGAKMHEFIACPECSKK